MKMSRKFYYQISVGTLILVFHLVSPTVWCDAGRPSDVDSSALTGRLAGVGSGVMEERDTS